MAAPPPAYPPPGYAPPYGQPAPGYPYQPYPFMGPYAPPGGTWPTPPKPWESFPPWLRRTFRIYLYGLVGALLLAGLLFVLNVFVPLPHNSLLRATGSLGLLLVGWFWGVLGAWMLSYRPLAPAGILGMATGVATIVFGTLAIWDLVGGYSLTRIPWALFMVQVVAAAGVAVERARLRREFEGLMWPAVGAIAVGAILLAVSILFDSPARTPDLMDKIGATGGGLAFPMCAAGVLFLIPKRPRLNLTRNLAYAGFVELALFLAIQPWVQDSAMKARMYLATFAIAIILGLVALTFYLIDAMDLRRGQAQA